MQIIYSKNYDKGLEELKKKHREDELVVLEEILDMIRDLESYDDLKRNPISYIYDFEELKNDKKGFSSFKLSRSGGVIRLIVRPQMNTIIIEVVFISTNHYKDFNPKGVIFYDE